MELYDKVFTYFFSIFNRTKSTYLSKLQVFGDNYRMRSTTTESFSLSPSFMKGICLLELDFVSLS